MNEIATPATTHQSQVPPAFIDRASLSEAWYRALYGSRGHGTADTQATARQAMSIGSRTAGNNQPASPTVAGRGASRPAGARALREFRALEPANPSRLGSKATTPRTTVQRTWRQAIARRISLRMQLAPGKTIEVLVQQRGRTVHVLTLGERETIGVAKAALTRAHTALRLAGIRVSAVSHATKHDASQGEES